MQKKSSQHIYDFVVVGGGLSGLLIACALSRNTKNVLLLDGADSFGGHNKSIQTAIGTMNNGIRILPAQDLAQKALPFLENLLGHPLQSQLVNEALVTFEAGSLKPFIGFGEHSPPFYDELAYFLNPQRLQLNLEPHEWVQLLFNNFLGEFRPRSYVTKFHMENTKVTSATINGQKTIQAENFIYCADLKSLSILLPEEGLSAKARHKLSKAKYWTAICLDLLHERRVTDSLAIHVLNGTTQDEVGPCAGYFQAATEINEQPVQFSQWISFIDNQDSEESEHIGNSLRKMKKQIKRAYPEALDNLKQERILVVPSIGGHGELKLSANQTIANLPNFWIGSGAAHKQKNLLGTLLQAELICSALACHPLGIQVAQNEKATADSFSEPQTPDLHV